MEFKKITKETFKRFRILKMFKYVSEDGERQDIPGKHPESTRLSQTLLRKN